MGRVGCVREVGACVKRGVWDVCVKQLRARTPSLRALWSGGKIPKAEAAHSGVCVRKSDFRDPRSDVGPAGTPTWERCHWLTRGVWDAASSCVDAAGASLSPQIECAAYNPEPLLGPGGRPDPTAAAQGSLWVRRPRLCPRSLVGQVCPGAGGTGLARGRATLANVSRVTCLNSKSQALTGSCGCGRRSGILRN